MLGQNLQTDPIVGLKALKQSFDQLYYQLKEPLGLGNFLSETNCYLPPNWGSKPQQEQQDEEQEEDDADIDIKMRVLP